MGCERAETQGGVELGKEKNIARILEEQNWWQKKINKCLCIRLDVLTCGLAVSWFSFTHLLGIIFYPVVP